MEQRLLLSLENIQHKKQATIQFYVSLKLLFFQLKKVTLNPPFTKEIKILFTELPTKMLF